MITISICMIVKDEALRLRKCLDSIKHIADEIIIVDTGSLDNTKEIASEYTERIFDYPWKNDFSAARNFAFSKATMDYIYSADADEYLDSTNQNAFAVLKQVLLPEVEIVTMYYVNKMEFNTTYNSKKELRPKLFKRLRSFKWMDPIHETIVTSPVIYDSNIEIIHKAHGNHSRRDIKALIDAFDSGKYFSSRLHSMYAKELFKCGTNEDFNNAFHVFSSTYSDSKRTSNEKKEASCILARYYRINNNVNEFMKLCLKDIAIEPCSEICVELGDYFFELKDYEEASIWYTNAAFETSSIIDIRTSGDIPLKKLCDSYNLLASNYSYNDPKLAKEYITAANNYRAQADAWTLPEEL